MPNLAFTNLDSLWLAQLSASLSAAHGDQDIVMGTNLTAAAIKARLAAIAANLQRLDEANAVLCNNRTYDEGYAAAMALMRKRSNVLSSHGISEADGKTIMDALTERVPITKVPMGKRALDDTPKFNGGFTRRAAPAKKPKVQVDLNLDFLENL